MVWKKPWGAREPLSHLSPQVKGKEAVRLGDGEVRPSKQGKECSERCLKTRVLLVVGLDFKGPVRVEGRKEDLGREETDPGNKASPRSFQRLQSGGHAQLGQQRAPRAQGENPGSDYSGQAEPKHRWWPALAHGTNETLPCPWRAGSEAGKGTGLCGEVRGNIQGRNRVSAVGAQLMSFGSRQASWRRQLWICGPAVMG